MKAQYWIILKCLILIFLELPQMGLAGANQCYEIFNTELDELIDSAQVREINLMNDLVSNRSYQFNKMRDEIEGILGHRRIQWKSFRGNEYAFEIMPARNGARLNRISAAISENYGGIKLVYDLKRNIETQSLSYVQNEKVIYLDFESILNDKIGFLFAHELRHMRNHFKYLNQEFVDSWAYTIPKQGRRITKDYPEFLFSEEVDTYSNQIFQQLRVLEGQKISKDQKSELEFTAAVGFRIVSFLAKNSEKDVLIVQNFKNESTKWDKLDRAMYGRGNKGIMISQSRIAGHNPNKQYETTIEIDNGSFSTDYTFVGKMSEKSTEDWISNATDRIERRAKLYKEIQVLWERLNNEIEEGHKTKAFKTARQIKNRVNSASRPMPDLTLHFGGDKVIAYGKIRLT